MAAEHRPGYLVYVPDRTPMLEPYTHSRFARQFSFDQLCFSNPNKDLRYRGNLFDEARAWLYSIPGCTGARFYVPIGNEEPKMVMMYCTWYVQAKETPGFDP